MKVYLVEDENNCPGCIYAVFAHRMDAEAFIVVSELEDDAFIVERTLFYGQPQQPGYNQ